MAATAPWAAHFSYAEASMTDPIALVKAVAAKLPSPPRLYATSGDAVSLWPDQQGSTAVAGLAGGGIDVPLRHPPFADQTVRPESSVLGRSSFQLLTSTDAASVPGGTAILLELRWSEEGSERSHAWLFHVLAGHDVQFIRELGHPLPCLPL